MKTNQIKFFILFFIAYCILSLSNSYGFSYKELHQFEIYRNGKKIGFNKLYFKKIDNKIVVNTKIETVIVKQDTEFNLPITNNEKVMEFYWYESRPSSKNSDYEYNTKFVKTIKIDHNFEV